MTLSKNARARAVQLPAWNEAMGLPRPWDQQWSLRLQQVLAYETDLLEYEDIFDGSKVIEAKVRELADGAREQLKRIELAGALLSARNDEGGAGGIQPRPHRSDRKRRTESRRRQCIHRRRALPAGSGRQATFTPSICRSRPNRSRG